MSLFSRLWHKLHVRLAAQQRRRTSDAMIVANVIAAAKAVEAGQAAARADKAHATRLRLVRTHVAGTVLEHGCN